MALEPDVDETNRPRSSRKKLAASAAFAQVFHRGVTSMTVEFEADPRPASLLKVQTHARQFRQISRGGGF